MQQRRRGRKHIYKKKRSVCFRKMFDDISMDGSKFRFEVLMLPTAHPVGPCVRDTAFCCMYLVYKTTAVLLFCCCCGANGALKIGKKKHDQGGAVSYATYICMYARRRWYTAATAVYNVNMMYTYTESYY